MNVNLDHAFIPNNNTPRENLLVIIDQVTGEESIAWTAKTARTALAKLEKFANKRKMTVNGIDCTVMDDVSYVYYDEFGNKFNWVGIIDHVCYVGDDGGRYAVR